MEDDDEATVHTIKAYREVMTDLIQRYHGKVVDAKGDNVLAEFSSVVEAARCGVEVQKRLKERNAGLPEHRRMAFRIGINLGDVIEEKGIIYGDGVNIAARLESLAEAGGICVSGSVYENIVNKVNLSYEYLGEREVKNIRRSVQVYRVLLDTDAGLAKEPETPDLPDKPSIAVLPFVNMSADPDQEYFSDGITEEIITGLSKIPELFVIARNSTFTYKGRSVRVQQVGQELGVRYVLEGSVRKAGDRVRITGQLIDAETGHHLWAERYDRNLKDIFALQDDITINIMRAMQVKLTEGDQACEWLRRGSENIEAYERGMKGMEYFRRFSPEGNTQARKMFEQGVALDPETTGNYVLLAWTYLFDVYNGWTNAAGKCVEKAAELTGKALALDESQAEPHALFGNIHLLNKDYEKAVAEGKRAIELNPNGADEHVWLAAILTWAGRPEEAIGLIKKALRLNPVPPNWYSASLGNAYLMAERYGEAMEEFVKTLEASPDFLLAHIGLIACYSLMGLKQELAGTVAKVLRIDPEFSLDRFAKAMPFMNQDVLQSMLTVLREIGLK
jgi:adenylate cyclase